MINPQKAARKVRKQLRGEITFETLTEYINHFGYCVILFNDYDEALTCHNIAEYAVGKSAFTYTQDTNIIFIRETLHANDKVILLLHEIGHIVLGHMKGNHLRVSDAIETEYQADTFAHLVLRPKSFPTFILPLGICLLSALLIVSFSYNICLINKQNAIHPEDYSIQTRTYSEPNTDYVYITQTGSKYHTKECNYASNGVVIELDEAQKIYTPCKHCNP